jgi:Arylsulfotransferase (ASST)
MESRRPPRTRPFLLCIGLLLTAVPVLATEQFAAALTCDTQTSTAPAAEVAGLFHGIAPVRVGDSRSALAIDGKLTPGCSVSVAMTAVPQQARAVSLNVTTVDAERPGFLIVYPCGTAVPATSNINSQVGAGVPNLVVVSLPESRRVCFVADHPTHVVVDVTGWFGSGGGGFVLGGTPAGTASTRLLDTRTGPRPDPAKGQWPAATELRLQVGPADGSWEAVSVNVTATDPLQTGFVVAYPCGQSVPATSTVNMIASSTRANQTLVALDSVGRLCLWSNVPTHLIVDVVGRFVRNTGAPLSVTTAQRVVDSRNSVGGWTDRFKPGLKRTVDPSGGSPQTSGIAVMNVTATGVTEAGFLTFYPCGGAVPTTSSLNFAPGHDSSNLVTVDANTCVTGTGTTHVVIDRLGWFGRPGGLQGLSAGQPGRLQPEFEPDGHDYSLPCTAGTNNIPVVLDAAPGRTLSVDGVPRGQSFAGSIAVPAGGLITVVVAGPTSTTETYAIRCLPADFPPVVASVPGFPTPGWYLTTLGYNTPGAGMYATILDEHGAVVWYRKANGIIFDLKRMQSGDVAWTNVDGFGPFGTDPANGYEQHRLNGSLVTNHQAVGSPTDHHDFRELPNGHLLVLTYLLRTGVDVSVLGAGYGMSDRVVDAVIQEIDPSLPSGSAPLWTWNSKDHFNVNETTFPQKFDLDGNGTPDTVDLVHINSIEPQANGDIVASFRHLDAVARISRSTGNIVWKVGGLAVTKDAGLGAKVLAITADPRGGPKRQHSASILANGNLLLFDNRTPLTVPGSPSIGPARAVEYAIDVAAGTARLVWNLDNPTGRDAFGLGSVQRLVDGDTLLNWGPIQPVMVQYDAASVVQWQITQPTGGIGYRVVKEPPASFDRATLRALAG